MTYDRFLTIVPNERIYIVTNEQYADTVYEQLPNLHHEQVLCEPERRNTAPCIAYAAYKIKSRDPEAVMVVTPADHTIFQENRFYEAISVAMDAALDDKIITIGIKPTKPETGYGYIQYLENDDQEVKKVKTFTEKPELEIAEKFLESGDFLWNAGIFVWSVRSITQAFEMYLPDIAELFEEGSKAYYTDQEAAYVKTAYSQSKNISVDYGIMEKAANVYVVLGDFLWSDVGSWASLHDLREKDENKNVVEANALLYNCHDNFVAASKKNKIVILQDLEGYLIADYDDVLLICKKDQDVKFREFFSDVKSKKGDKYL